MRVRATYGGRVQGVGFRATTREIAAGWRVAGWVRNERDGTVTVEAQGEAGEVDRFLGEVSRVLGRYILTTERIEIAESANAGESGFVIER